MYHYQNLFHLLLQCFYSKVVHCTVYSIILAKMYIIFCCYTCILYSTVQQYQHHSLYTVLPVLISYVVEYSCIQYHIS